MKKFLHYKTRSVWKGCFFVKNENIAFSDITRYFVIKKKMVGRIFYVPNGKGYIKFRVLRKYIGFKFGQFILTKKLGNFIHKIIDKKAKKKKNKGSSGKKSIIKIKSSVKKVKKIVKKKVKKK